jgi:hypothetical protein
MKLALAGASSLALVVSAHAALACGGDASRTDRWSLDRTEYVRYYDRDAGLPFLSPGNDSRINLQFLMMDARPWPVGSPPGSSDLESTVLFERSALEGLFRGKPAGAPDPGASGRADGEGSRCASLGAGAQAFAEAAQAEKGLAEIERNALVNARNQFSASCNDQAAAPPEQDFLSGLPQPSPAAREFAAYLSGAKAFYDGAFDRAEALFASLGGAKNLWLKETARYMAGRAQLNKAQLGAFAAFDQSGKPNVTDKPALEAAEAAFNTYLADYPTGRYAASARGLKRRLYWLGDDQPRLAGEYGRTITQSADPKTESPDLAEEIDWKFLRPDGTLSHDPNLLAAADLIRLRSADNGTKPKFPASDLEAQAPDFRDRESLFDFLRAARAYYADGDAASALQALGPASYAPLAPVYLAFSREMLRGQALMAKAQFAEAADHWAKLLPLATQPWQKEAVELGLAMAFERAGTLNKAFLPATRIASARIRLQVLTYAAGPILLRQAIADPLSLPEERRQARFVLLFKEATRGQYANFLRDYDPAAIAKDEADAPKMTESRASTFNWPGGVDDSYACPALKTVMTELAGHPGASHPLLCLGEFTRTQSLDGVEAGQPGPDELAGAKPIFPGEIFARGEIYKKLIANPATPSTDRAYALYRAVNCYKPSGRNDCGGKDVGKAQRKAWYDELKARHGATSWAQSLRYYW